MIIKEQGKLVYFPAAPEVIVPSCEPSHSTKKHNKKVNKKHKLYLNTVN